ncbi:hypothetical protein ACLKA7_015752 [Drosophila subpalustris]
MSDCSSFERMWLTLKLARIRLLLLLPFSIGIGIAIRRSFLIDFQSIGSIMQPRTASVSVTTAPSGSTNRAK